MSLRDLALTVLELEQNEYHWVLMEAVQAESDDLLGYRPVDSSTVGLPDYSEALIQGASALRVLQGLAPFGKPMSPVGLGGDAEAPPPVAQQARSASELRGGLPTETDSCLFTTGHNAM